MRRRSVVIVSVAVLLSTVGLVAGYQRVSALTCSTPAYTARVGVGDRGPGACLLYLALAPDTPPVRASRAPADPPAAEPAAVDRSPSPVKSQPSASATEPEPAPTPDSTPVADGSSTCQGQAFDFWQEVVRSCGDDSSCQTYVDAIAETAAENPQMAQPGPPFQTSGETQYYYSLLDEETDWD